MIEMQLEAGEISTWCWTVLCNCLVKQCRLLCLTIAFLDSGGGLAWTYVHLIHGVITFYLLHWSKGSPIQDEQGKWDFDTFWEQLDDGQQGTITRKFFTVVPVALFVLATHGSDFGRQPLLLNLVVVVVLVVAKIPLMHRVRIFGINRY